jgi:hypothetical protein
MARTYLLVLAGMMTLGFALGRGPVQATDISVCKNPAECSVHAP